MSVDVNHLRRLHARRMYGAGWDVPHMVGGGIWSSLKSGFSSVRRHVNSFANSHLLPAATAALAAATPIVQHHARIALGAAKDNVNNAVMAGNLKGFNPLRAAAGSYNPAIWSELQGAAQHGLRALPKL